MQQQQQEDELHKIPWSGQNDLEYCVEQELEQDKLDKELKQNEVEEVEDLHRNIIIVVGTVIVVVVDVPVVILCFW